MLENQDIHTAIRAIMEAMRRQGTSPGRLKNFENSYNVFERYLSDNGIANIDESICLEYVYVKTGQRFERFECVTSNGTVNYRMRPLLLLLRYLQDGQFSYDVRKTKPPFVCPACFESEYETFCEELVYRGYSQATIDSNTPKVQVLIAHLVSQGVTSSADIGVRHIESFLKTIEDKAVKYVGVFLYVFRKFFSFLYERGYTAYDLAPMLPKVRTPRNASIPYVWSKKDIQKLLGAIDRKDPKGKRDYAILLIAIRLGLRIGDIRNLKQSSIDWNRKTINLKMSKTGQPIELPLLKDIGWAIIDYLQNGRPATNSECLFVRHKAPFNAFGDRNAFNKELHRYILKAGLNMPGDRRMGCTRCEARWRKICLRLNHRCPSYRKRWGISPSTPQAYTLRLTLKDCVNARSIRRRCLPVKTPYEWKSGFAEAAQNYISLKPGIRHPKSQKCNS